jgi:hypothetical protein
MGLAYRVLRKVFGQWITPLFAGLGFSLLRLLVVMGQALDLVLSSRLRKTELRSPVVIVGNPRTGTTFLQRFLVDNGVGCGQELWRMLYASLVVQFFVRPFLPLLEKLSPARHHSTVAHKTSLVSVETDDVSFLFRYFDGFFLYGFFLAFDEEEHVDLFDPRLRDTTERDFRWLERCWRRSMVAHRSDRVVAKLFSLSPRLSRFQERFGDARVLYMVRDPLSVIPSAMSLVTGVLDKKFGFWSLDEGLRARYLERLYLALVDLMRRFHEDWEGGRIDRERVFIVRYDRMMADFDGLMEEMLTFIGHTPDESFKARIATQAEKQRAYRSGHAYDLSRFGLDEARIRQDCRFLYEGMLATPAAGPATT